MFIKNRCILVIWTKVALALEVLKSEAVLTSWFTPDEHAEADLVRATQSCSISPCNKVIMVSTLKIHGSRNCTEFGYIQRVAPRPRGTVTAKDVLTKTSVVCLVTTLCHLKWNSTY